jgi:hypothetical protein
MRNIWIKKEEGPKRIVNAEDAPAAVYSRYIRSLALSGSSSLSNNPIIVKVSSVVTCKLKEMAGLISMMIDTMR